MATTAEKLAEAQAAYHKLQTGQSARVVVDQNGERVEFTSVNRTSLYNYILELQGMIDNSLTTPTPRRPARFFFG